MMVNCEKASVLSSKKLDFKLTIWEKISLKFHTFICSTCELFEEESNVISESIIKHNHSEKCKHSLSKESKIKMQKLLDQRK